MTKPTQIGDNSNAQLKAFVERIENLNEEKAALTADIKSVFDEAKAAGFNKKALRKVIAIRARDADERQAEEAAIDEMLHALGML